MNKLQNLCNIANKRYSSGKNTDDIDKKIFDFATKNTSYCVVIGYDNYNAIEFEQVIELLKDNTEAIINEEKDFSFIKINYKTYRIKTELIKIN